MPFDELFERNPEGRPPFAPTLEQRRMVEASLAFGMPQEKVRLGIINPETDRPISLPTFEKHFATEIECAADKLKTEVSTFMVNTIFGRDVGAGALPIRDEGVRGRLLQLFARARMGLEETVVNRHEGTGPGGAIVFVARGADAKL